MAELRTNVMDLFTEDERTLIERTAAAHHVSVGIAARIGGPVCVSFVRVTLRDIGLGELAERIEPSEFAPSIYRARLAAAA